MYVVCSLYIMNSAKKKIESMFFQYLKTIIKFRREAAHTT